MMPLFVVQHDHAPETCPVSPENGSLLLDHVSAAVAARYGVAIQAEAVLNEKHRIILIVQAPDQARVERFAALLGRFGDVRVLPASTSEEAVARGTCIAM